jgi:hypothetical protein
VSHGLAVNGFGSTAYNGAAGGTDFQDYYNELEGDTTYERSHYWAASNGSGDSSALSYVAETTWNDTCASSILSYYEESKNTDPNALCDTAQYLATGGGGGGVSILQPRPSWQNGTVYGIPPTSTYNFRLLPDVSLFASNGFWGHALDYFQSDVSRRNLQRAGGTSFVSPQLAGVFALIAQKTEGLMATLINIVHYPGNNVAAVFAAGAPQGPFQPVLSAQPNDWTMSITYGGCTPACGGLNTPGSLAIDSGGNVLVANYFGGVISKFSSAGVPASATGIPGIGLDESYGIAIDGFDNVWVANYQSVTGATNHHVGSVSEFSSVGVELSGYGYTSGGVYYPKGAAADSNGTIWVADYASSSATLLANDGSAISGSSGYGPSALPFTSAVALDGSHNAWFAVQRGAARVTSLGAVSNFSCCNDPEGIAIDLSGNVWIADYSASAIVELTSSGSVAQRVGLSNSVGPQGIAIDGAGNVWAANYYGDSLVELAGSTAAIVSPSDGYGLDAPLKEPYGLAIDATGNLWLSNAGGNTLTQFVGLATPIKTPLLGPPVEP